MKKKTTLTPLLLLLAPAHALNLNTLLTTIDTLFPGNLAVRTADAAIGSLEAAVGDVLGLQTTRDDLAARRCGDVMVLFARGTAEPGNVGAIVGPAFFNALVAAAGVGGGGKGVEVAFTGVGESYYPASIADYFSGGSESGAQQLASLVTTASTTCPDTPLVMSGYSQGAQVVHKAAALLLSSSSGAGDGNTTLLPAKVSSVVTFGDPDSASAIEGIDAARVLQICHDGDDICRFGDLLTLKHFTYAENVTAAAAFVVSNL